MIKYLILTAIIALSILQPPLQAQTVAAPFTSSSPSSTTTSSVSAKFISIKSSVSNEKIIIDWLVEENQAANMFEIEKSYNGKDFTLAAIIFGTDQAAANSYQFYEKKSMKKVFYRIKIINKNEETEYSDPVVISPST